MLVGSFENVCQQVYWRDSLQIGGKGEAAVEEKSLERRQEAERGDRDIEELVMILAGNS
jgi:hypothetical protein